MLNVIKKSIFNTLNAEYSGKVYYGVIPEDVTGDVLVYQVFNINDNDTHIEERVDASIQVAIYSPTNALKSQTSLESDTKLDRIKELLKLNDLTLTDTGITISTESLLVTNTIPAIYDNRDKRWLAVIRFQATFTITRS